jgi:hypothetical protein
LRVATALAVMCLLAGTAEALPFKEVEAGGSCGGGFRLRRCGPGLFCESGLPGCHAYDWAGKCVMIPSACPESAAPVCGCDQQTYRNDCERQRARAQIAHKGPCSSDGR